jgi:hypothetical protein
VATICLCTNSSSDSIKLTGCLQLTQETRTGDLHKSVQRYAGTGKGFRAVPKDLN